MKKFETLFPKENKIFKNGIEQITKKYAYQFILSFCSSLESEICYAENQSDIDKHKTTMVSSIQEFNREGKLSASFTN